jgi:hypothetical protein
MSILKAILSSGRKTLIDKLFDIVDDYMIYEAFIDDELGTGPVHSPLRHTDDHPSFHIFTPTRVSGLRPGTLFYKDLGNGDTGNVISFVKKFAEFNYGLNLVTNKEIVDFISSKLDLDFHQSSTNLTRRSYDREAFQKNSKIFVKYRPYTKYDLKYWGVVNATAEDLKYFNINSIKYILDEHGNILKTIKNNELAFWYNILDAGKLYRPHESRFNKFRNTCPGNNPNYYQGINQVKFKKDVLITKSMKDVVGFTKVFEALNWSIDVIAPHAESVELAPQFITWADEKYENKYVVADYDPAGIKFAEKCEEFGYKKYFISTEQIKINGEYKVLDKDLYDYAYFHGFAATVQLIKNWNLQ